MITTHQKMEETADCNLDLQLHPSSSSSSSLDATSTSSIRQHQLDDHLNHQHQLHLEKMPGGELPLTIFYAGEIYVVNVDQQRARSIMGMAAKGTGREDWKLSTPYSSNPMTNLSMKRSLQRFLERRKHRIRSMNPYRD
ncbi:hypothetical protein MLD38_027626 [Melastoma candidum]|uniref:Uncharacterized protein n=1 Tax=Melastoma candidum TaxID=119954 RepID=A0ACB9P3M8_9MYRT|nr:hypothetical protein MLD38_027626 [Melastoma candidum]